MLVGCAANPPWFLGERGGFCLLTDLPPGVCSAGEVLHEQAGAELSGETPLTVSASRRASVPFPAV